jgi:uncharacterized cupin superfamily protein
MVTEIKPTAVDKRAETGIQLYDQDQAFGAMEPWPTDILEILEGPIAHRGSIIYRDPSRQLSLGVWECEPGKFRFVEDGSAIETCVMGRATITDEETGRSITVTPGSSWTVKPGTVEIWEVHERFRKEYVILDEFVDEGRFW